VFCLSPQLYADSSISLLSFVVLIPVGWLIFILHLLNSWKKFCPPPKIRSILILDGCNIFDNSDSPELVYVISSFWMWVLNNFRVFPRTVFYHSLESIAVTVGRIRAILKLYLLMQSCKHCILKESENECIHRIPQASFCYRNESWSVFCV
jgi:hypothetical protein